MNTSRRPLVGWAMDRLRLLVLALAGCSSANASELAGTRYSCDAIAIAPQPAADHGVVGPWRALAEAPDTDAPWIGRVQALANRPLPALGLAERVRLQHQLLRVAKMIALGREGNPAWPGWEPARAGVVAAIRAVAPTTAELATLGDGAHPAITAVLGTNVTERATRGCVDGTLQHVSAFGGLLAFRPLRAGTTRALVAQLVAIDRDGAPHVTPLVDEIELRLGDDTAASPACVVAAGDDGVLRTVAHADLHEQRFVSVRGEGVGCNDCHAGTRTRGYDVPADSVPAYDRARAGQVERLAGRLWARVVAPEPAIE